MKFEAVPIAEAQGAILAHSQRLSDGSIKKGTLITAAHIDSFRRSQIDTVTVARLQAGDVAEDEAAQMLARRLAGPGIRVSAPFTGRCNLFADRAGVALVDGQQIHGVNAVHESITVATIVPYHPVAARQMLATIKIIPFAVNEADLSRAMATLNAAPAVQVVESHIHRPVLIQTRLAGTREEVLDKTSDVTRQRLQGLGVELELERRCEHAMAPLAEQIEAALAGGADLIMVVGASAIVDRRDVIPQAIEASGGEVMHFGMPVDPGNLMLFAEHGRVPVLGLPGCARSKSYNGLDQVLVRLVAGQGIQLSEVVSLGVGGLLKEFAQRPQPRHRDRARANVAGNDASAIVAPVVGAIVLAAGQSRRMGDSNKLLADVFGKPMLVHVLDAVADSAISHCVVVTGHQAQAVRRLLAQRDVEAVHNARYEQGLSTSLVCGLNAIADKCDAVMVCLGDMPRIRARELDRLIAAFDPGEGRAICVPTFGGKRGNPVLWDIRYSDELRALQGDVGARHLIGQHHESVCEVEMDADAVLNDIDSPAALEKLRGDKG